ncbi:MAG: rhodanese-like domain-containing protein [Desulfomonilaceae bacterium]
MRFSLFLKAALIVTVCFMIGIISNLFPFRHIPWIYCPPKEIVISNHKVPLITSKEAERLAGDLQTVFVDARSQKDYMKGHIQGAISLPSDEKEQKFATIEPLLPQNGRLILYCHGPDCDMAEKDASFLFDFGYSNLMIMTDGYPAWEQNGFPVEKPDNHK